MTETQRYQQIPVKDYLRGKAGFEPLSWGPKARLEAGMVLKLSHAKNTRTLLFECVDVQGGRMVDGLLTILDGEYPIEVRTPVKANLKPPVDALASGDKLSVVFEEEKSDGHTRITPAFDTALVAYREDLALIAMREELENRLYGPLSTDEARRTVADIIVLLDGLAEQDGDPKRIERLQIASQVIREELG